MSRREARERRERAEAEQHTDGAGTPTGEPTQAMDPFDLPTGEPTQAMDARDLPGGSAAGATAASGADVPTQAMDARELSGDERMRAMADPPAPATASAGYAGPEYGAPRAAGPVPGASAPRQGPPRAAVPGAHTAGRASADAGASAGALGTIRRNPKTPWLVAAAIAAFVVLGGGALAAGAAVGGAAVAAPAPSPTHTRTPKPTPTERPTPATPAPAAAVRTCTVGSLATDSRLGDMEAQVRDAKTGAVLFSRHGDTPHATASVMKIVTGSAALAALGPDYRLTTKVVAGPDPGSVIIVGGGDSTLSRLPDGVEPYYRGAAHIDDLAKATVEAMKGTPITKVYVDISLYGKPYWQPTWNVHEERDVDGSSSLVTALQVDGDRANPQAMDSQRSSDPVTPAVNAFISALDANGENVPTVSNADSIEKTAAKDATELAKVQSQPISKLITLALTDSDNTIMETLARQVAIKEGTGNTFSAENAGVVKALASYGISTKGLHIADGSGLSEDNRVPPSYLTQLLVKVKNDSDLKAVYDGLPVAGETGTLGPGFNRFVGSSSAARGHVHAKTGSVDDGYSLSGLIEAKDGSTLTFAIYAFGKVDDSARTAIDALTTGFYDCGANLSDR